MTCTTYSGKPHRSPSAAPKDAPLATPSVSGVANGLENRLWNAAPATASPPPTSRDSSTRGRRIDQTMASDLLASPDSPSILCPSAENTSRTGMV